MLGGEPKATYWDATDVAIARETRNCIAHLGGRAKQELLDLGPAYFVSPKQMIGIRPEHTHALYTSLKTKVEGLVDEMLPKFPA